MIQTGVLIISILLFIIAPTVFFLITFFEFRNNRFQGREYDFIYSGIRENLELLKTEDLAKFDGEFSNWLVNTIKKVKSQNIQASLRLLIQAKYIGLGEGHRERISADTKYRDVILKKAYDLSSSYKEGDDEKIFSNIADLLNLFMKSQSISKDQQNNNLTITNDITSQALENTAKKIEEGDIFASLELSKALKQSARTRTIRKNNYSLLILQWALIKSQLKSDPYENFFIFNSKNTLSKKFRKIATLNRKSDIRGIINVISRKNR